MFRTILFVALSLNIQLTARAFQPAFMYEFVDEFGGRQLDTERVLGNCDATCDNVVGTRSDPIAGNDNPMCPGGEIIMIVYLL